MPRHPVLAPNFERVWATVTSQHHRRSIRVDVNANFKLSLTNDPTPHLQAH